MHPRTRRSASGVWQGIPFAPKSHYELGTRLGLFDFERGVKVATSRFLFLKAPARVLERALINFISISTSESTST